MCYFVGEFKWVHLCDYSCFLLRVFLFVAREDGMQLTLFFIDPYN
ncbi:protein of unknown function [Serratia sp. Tan611]|nr:protein of unknown function [Serratia sp. Tan611]